MGRKDFVWAVAVLVLSLDYRLVAGLDNGVSLTPALG